MATISCTETMRSSESKVISSEVVSPVDVKVGTKFRTKVDDLCDVTESLRQVNPTMYDSMWTGYEVECEICGVMLKQGQTCFCNTEGKFTEEELNYLEFWRRKWWNHPLAGRFGKSEEEYVSQPFTMGDISFDWQRFLEMKNLVLKFKDKSRIFHQKPKQLRQITDHRGRTFEAPFQTWFCGKSKDCSVDDIMCESYNLYNYKPQTHYRFTFAEMEGALNITRRIWQPRLRYQRNGKAKWTLIYMTCWDFLCSLQDEKTGWREQCQERWHNIQNTCVEAHEDDNGEIMEETVEPEDYSLKADIFEHNVEEQLVVEEDSVHASIVEKVEFDEAIEVEKKVFKHKVRWSHRRTMPDKVKKNDYYVSTRTYFTDLDNVYKRIGREDLAFKRHLPAPYNLYNHKGLTSKANNYIVEYFKSLMSPMEIEPQSGGCSDDIERNKARRVLTSVISLLTNHRDKMLILSHRGRFNYLTKWDMQLFAKQKSKIQNLKIMIKPVENVFPVMQIKLPESYVEECEAVMWLCQQVKPNSNSMLVQAFNAIKILIDRWENAEFEVIKTRCEGKMEEKDISNTYYFKDNTVILKPSLYGECSRRLLIPESGNDIPVEPPKKPAISLFELRKLQAEVALRSRAERKRYQWNVEPQAGDGLQSSAAPAKDGVTTTSTAPPPPITSGEQKVTVVMAEERDVMKSEPKDVATGVSKKGVSQEEIYRLLDTVKRPMLIDRLTWSTSDPLGKSLKEYMLPNSYFDTVSKQKTICQNLNANFIMAMFGSCRFDVKIRIQVNCAKFQQGQLIFIFKPFFDSSRSIDIFNNSLQFDPEPLRINAENSNPVEMTIPWSNMRDYFPLYTDTHAELNYFGVGSLNVWNPLRTGASTSTDASVSVWMWLENLEVHQLCNPKPPNLIHFADRPLGFPPDDVTIRYLLVQPDHKIERVGEWEPQSGVMNTLLTSNLASSVVDTGVNELEKVLRNVLSRGEQSKPHQVLPAPPTKINVSGNLGHGEGVSEASRMALHPIQVTEPMTEQKERVNYKHLLRKWSRIQVGEWTTDLAENTTIVKIPVTPMQNAHKSATQVDLALTSYSPKVDQTTGQTVDLCNPTMQKDSIKLVRRYGSMLDYLCKMFQYWRGGLEFRIEVVCTQMQTGRLFIRYEPFANDSSAVAECSKLATPGVNWDIFENHVIDIHCPYFSTQEFLSTQQCIEGEVDTNNFAMTAMGAIEVSVVNRLKVTSGVSSGIQVNVYMRAAPDFEFKTLNSLEGIHSYRIHNGDMVASNQTDNPEWQKIVDAFWVGVQAVFKMFPQREVVQEGTDYKISKSPRFNAVRAEFNLILRNNTSLAAKASVLRRITEAIKDNYSKIKIPNLTWEEAFEWLCRFNTLPRMVIDVHNKMGTGPIGMHSKQKIFAWLAYVISKFDLPNVGLPDTESREFYWYETIKPAEIEPQSRSQAIDPFKNFVQRSFRENTIEEKFDDLYKQCKREMAWRHVSIPPAIEDRGFDWRYKQWFFQGIGRSIAVMDEPGFSNYYFEWSFPVTPMMWYHSVGDPYHYFVSNGNVDKSVYYQEWELSHHLGHANDSSLASITHLRHLSELFTFWRGSLRYKFVFPITKRQDGVDWHVKISCNSRRFVPHGVSEKSIALVSKERVRQSSQYGMVLFQGNVMNSIEVEVPFYSKYGKLYLSDSISDATTTAGSVSILVPLVAKQNIDCDQGKTVDDFLKKLTVDSLPVEVYVSLGDDFEFLQPRAAPNINLYTAYFNKKPSDTENDMGYATLDLVKATGKYNIPSTSVVREVAAQGIVETSKINPVRTVTKYLTKPYLMSLIGSRVADDVKSASYINRWNINYPIPDKEPPFKATTTEIEPQSGDGEIVETPTQTNPEEEDELDGMFKNLRTALNVLPGGLQDFRNLVVEVQKLTEVLPSKTKVDETLTAIKESAEETKQGASMFKNSMKFAADYVFDGARIILFFKGFKDLVDATSWQDRWFPIAQCAMALGISVEVVTNAGKWLLSWMTTPEPEKVHEVRAEGSYEDMWDMSWSAFLEKHSSLLKFIAAGIGTMFMFMFTSKTPCSNKITDFSNSMLHKLKNFAIIGTAVKTFDWLFKWIGNVITSAIKTIGDWATGGQVTAYAMSQYYPEVCKWLRDVESFDNAIAMSELAWNQDKRFELWKAMDQGEALLRKITNKMGSLYITIMRGLDKLNKIQGQMLAVVDLVPFRSDPFHICLTGHPNTKKSAILTTILNFVCNEMGYPKKHRFYALNEKDDFWPNYMGQICVVVDDLYANRKGVSMDELIKMKTNLPYYLNMADTKDKGRPFVSKLIGSTTNTPYPEPPDMTCKEAIWRRRNMLIHVERTGSATDMVDIKTDLKFSLLDPNAGKADAFLEGCTGMNLRQLLVIILTTYKHYNNIQQEIVFRALNGEEIEIPDYEDPPPQTEEVKTNFEAIKQMLRLNVKLSDHFVNEFFKMATPEEVQYLRETFHEKLQNFESYKIVDNNIKTGQAIDKIINFINRNRHFQAEQEMILHESLFQTGTGENDAKIWTPLDKQFRYTFVGTVNPETSIREYRLVDRIPQGSFEEILEEARTKVEDISDEEYHIRAEDFLNTQEQLGHAFQRVKACMMPPCKKRKIKVASNTEIENFVSNHFPNITDTDRRKELIDNFKKAFNAAQSQGKNIATSELNSHYSKLFHTDHLKYWKQVATDNKKPEEKHWIMDFDDAQVAEDEALFELYSVYQLMITNLTQEEIDKMKELCIAPKAIVKDGIFKTSIKFLENHKIKLQKWIEDHPNIARAIKMGAVLAAVFAGYKMLQWLVPGTLDSIKVSLAALFGWGVNKTIGQERYESVKSYGQEWYGYGREKAADMKELMRRAMRLSSSKEVRDASDDENAVERLAEALPRVMQNAQALVRCERSNGVPEAKRNANPYMTGQDRVHKESTGPFERRTVNIPQSSQKVTIVQPEGNTDQTAQNIRENILLSNIVTVQYSAGLNTKRDVLGIFVEGRALLIPYHFMEGLSEGETFVVIDTKGIDYWDKFEPSRCAKLEGVDACIYQCGITFPIKKTILNHFPNLEDIKIRRVDATLNTLSVGNLIVQPVEAELEQDIDYELDSGTYMNNNYTWSYKAQTAKGDCGSILLAQNSAVLKKILGFHVAGGKTVARGFSALIQRHALERAISLVPPVSRVKAMPKIDTVTQSASEMKVLPQGNFEYVGAVEKRDAVALPMKTEIQPSYIHGLVREPCTAPSVLNQNDPRNKSGKNPLITAIEKYGKRTLPFDSNDFKYVSKYMESKVLSFPIYWEARVLTDWEAVFGDEYVPFFDRMNLASSPGYPWIKMRPSGEKGKEFLYDIDSNDGIKHKEYLEKYRKRERLAKQGERIESLWTDCLKDERRPLAKIAEGKTRAFMIAPADFVQLCRKYMLAFCICFYQNHTESFSAVGIDPYSFDWTRLARRLGKKTKLGFGGDFHSFDGILSPNIMWELCNVMNAWYRKNDPNWKEEDDVVREVLFEEMIHTAHICVNSVYIDSQGNKSGNPITVIINTFAHKFYAALSFIGIQKDEELLKYNGVKLERIYDLHDYDREVRDVYYGDDGLQMPTEEISKFFNLKTMSEFLINYGIEYTPESKDGEYYTVRPLTELTFLKNGFKRLKGTSFWLAPISENTIYELTNWIRRSDDPVGQLRENLACALKFAFHHGPEFFDTFLARVNDALVSRRLEPFPASYAMEKDKFLFACRT